MPLVDKLLEFLVEHEGSDLLLSAGSRPMIRVHGTLKPIEWGDNNKILSNNLLRKMIDELLNEQQRKIFDSIGDLDLAYELEGVARFRTNVFRQTNGFGMVLRCIPHIIQSLEELGMPEGVRILSLKQRGFILVTGPTGSGKTTTMAAMMDLINNTRQCHIVTVEEPIEFVHLPKKSLITHREVGRHTGSFAEALRVVMREDPDIVLVGEMRDLETISMALTVAETGVLVLATLHTISARHTINRIIDVFPYEQRNQVRTLLAEGLTGVVSQQLMRRADAKGRVAAAEVLISNPAISSCIREGKIDQMASLMESGKKHGMQMLDDHLMDLMSRCIISPEIAREKAGNKALFQ